MKNLKLLCVTLLFTITFGGCELFDNTASITISLDGEALRQFVDDNVDKPVTKGGAYNPITDGAISLALRVIVSGDENRTSIFPITYGPQSSSDVYMSATAKIDNLSIGAKIKVRVDLVKNYDSRQPTTIISGGTKWFKVTYGENNVSIQMGNFSDILLWSNSSFDFFDDYDETTRSLNDTTIINNKNWLTFDGLTKHLVAIYNNSTGMSLWNTSSWREKLTDTTGTFLHFGSATNIAACNGTLYYWNNSSGQTCIINTTGLTPTITISNTGLDSSLSGKSFELTNLTFSPNGKKAYISFKVTDNYLTSHYITSCDNNLNNGSLNVANLQKAFKVKVTGLCSLITEKKALYPGLINQDGRFVRISDIHVQDDYVWVLVKEFDNLYTNIGVSRGALIRFNMSLQNPKFFGWTPDNQRIRSASESTSYYYTPKNQDSKTFFGPSKFVAIRPGELVIVEDGLFKETTTGSRLININRMIFFDTEKEIVSQVIDCNYSFDEDYSSGFYPISGN